MVERLSYDAWGKRRNANGTDDLSNALVSAITDHGYTGHEHLDDMGLIHMNGRVYDPRTGRFLQADPTIQSPGNLQSFNRYTYVMNNPFFYTDPSGFSWLGDRWHALTGTNWADSRDQYVKPIVAIAVSIAMPGYGGAFLSGMISSGGDLKAGLLAMATAGMFNVVGNMNLVQGGFASVLAHGTVGGISSVLQRGSFQSGFLAAGFTQAFAPGISNIDRDTMGASLGRTIAAAVVGGTASVLGGGKFANGAITGAFSRLYNDDQIAHQQAREKSWLGRTVDNIRDGISGGFGLGGQAHFVGVGVSGDVSAVGDTHGAVCLQVTACLNIGPGLALGGGTAYSGSTGSASEGWSGTVGGFSSGGAGGFAEGQLLVNPAGGVSAGKAYEGVGGGASIGVSGCFSYTGVCK